MLPSGNSEKYPPFDIQSKLWTLRYETIPIKYESNPLLRILVLNPFLFLAKNNMEVSKNIKGTINGLSTITRSNEKKSNSNMLGGKDNSGLFDKIE